MIAPYKQYSFMGSRCSREDYKGTSPAAKRCYTIIWKVIPDLNLQSVFAQVKHKAIAN